MFVDPALRSNTPFSLTQNRFKLNGDYRGPGTWKLSGGIDWDNRERTYTEVVTTRETTLWGRASVQALENVGCRSSSRMPNATPRPTASPTGSPPENPLMRKYNLAARKRDTAGARADWAVSETVSLGLGVDYANDDYHETVIGLTDADTLNLAADITVALSEQTRFHAFAQGEKTSSRQTGSQAFGAPDWTGKVDDKFEVLGFGIKHAAIPDKLDLGADLWFSRARSDISTQTDHQRPAVSDGQDHARRRQALRQLQDQRQGVAVRQLLVRGLQLAGLAPRRRAAGHGLQPARVRQPGTALLPERGAGVVALPLLTSRIDSAAIILDLAQADPQGQG